MNRIGNSRLQWLSLMLRRFLSFWLMSMHSIDPSLERVTPPPSFQPRFQPLTQERLGNQQQQQNSQHHDSHSHQGATARREFETMPVRWSRRWWCSNSIVRVSTPIIKRWHTWFYWKWWGGFSWSWAGRVSISLLYGIKLLKNRP